MTKYLSIDAVLTAHAAVIEVTGGAPGLRDQSALEASVATPAMTFGGEDLYTTLAEKAAALGYALIMNHPFVDGNKRIGYVAMETFLVQNGYELQGEINEQERVILAVAAGEMDREPFSAWVTAHTRPLAPA